MRGDNDRQYTIRGSRLHHLSIPQYTQYPPRGDPTKMTRTPGIRFGRSHTNDAMKFDPPERLLSPTVWLPWLLVITAISTPITSYAVLNDHPLTTSCLASWWSRLGFRHVRVVCGHCHTPLHVVVQHSLSSSATTRLVQWWKGAIWLAEDLLNGTPSKLTVISTCLNDFNYAHAHISRSPSSAPNGVHMNGAQPPLRGNGRHSVKAMDYPP